MRVAVRPETVVVGLLDEVEDGVCPCAGMLCQLSVVCCFSRVSGAI